MSPVAPSAIRPGSWLKVSQIDAPRPSSATAPSIWYAVAPTPQRNPGGKLIHPPMGCGRGRGESAAGELIAEPCPLVQQAPADPLRSGQPGVAQCCQVMGCRTGGQSEPGGDIAGAVRSGEQDEYRCPGRAEQ